MLYILDTDHISLLQRDHPQVIANLARIARRRPYKPTKKQRSVGAND